MSDLVYNDCFWKMLGVYAAECRTALGISMSDVALHVGLPLESYKGFEKGIVTLDLEQIQHLIESLTLEDERIKQIMKLSAARYIFDLERIYEGQV